MLVKCHWYIGCLSSDLLFVAISELSYVYYPEHVYTWEEYGMNNIDYVNRIRNLVIYMDGIRNNVR